MSWYRDAKPREKFKLKEDEVLDYLRDRLILRDDKDHSGDRFIARFFDLSNEAKMSRDLWKREARETKIIDRENFGVNETTDNLDAKDRDKSQALDTLERVDVEMKGVVDGTYLSLVYKELNPESASVYLLPHQFSIRWLWYREKSIKLRSGDSRGFTLLGGWLEPYLLEGIVSVDLGNRVNLYSTASEVPSVLTLEYLSSERVVIALNHRTA